MDPAPQLTQSSSRLMTAARVIVVSSVMFTFISYWRTAAVVLCDLASTAYYIGGIVENAIGPAAPWFILAVMLFSYAVRSVYIESCSLFVRGGVYRVVKEAMGGFLAKLSVSALMFDYILTGPTSGVSAGQYIMGLALQFLHLFFPQAYDALGLGNQDPGGAGEVVKRWGAVILAIGVTLYFFRQNLIGIHESSDKALKIMIATTIMAVVMITWCLVTLAIQGPANTVPWRPDLSPKVEHKEIDREAATNPERYTSAEEKVWVRDPSRSDSDRLVPELTEDDRTKPRLNEALKEIGIEAQDNPLGFLDRLAFADLIRGVVFLGLFIAFGHSILAMSGEETLAQVYREVEAPKMRNFKRAAFIVFVYSLFLTAGISFLAVMLVPDEVRMKFYQDNLIGGLARHVIGPDILKLCLETFVVVVGFLILAGAVNTAIIGSNGVLNRVAEDGVLPDWFLRPHPRYGTTYRVLLLIAGLQVGVILVSQGHVIILGEAYAFGVVWSFVFKALSMVVLRFKDKTPREYKVPLNFHISGVEIPVGLGLIFLVLLTTAVFNLFTKEVATVGGVTFTVAFLTVFVATEAYHECKRRGMKHKHQEQFNQQSAETVNRGTLGLSKRYCKLIAIRSPQNLFMLEKSLEDTDPATTDVVVMTAKVAPVDNTPHPSVTLDSYDQQLMTAVVERAEKIGKQIKPLIVPTNNPLHAVLRTARDLGAQEIVIGASNKFTADEQFDLIGFYWIDINGGQTPPLTVRILSKDRDLHFDLGGGNRIPRQVERRARSVAELRQAGIGIGRILLVHEDSPEGLDLYQGVLTMLDSSVALTLAVVAPEGGTNGASTVPIIRGQAEQLMRKLSVQAIDGDIGPAVVRRAMEGSCDAIIIGVPAESPHGHALRLADWVEHVVRNGHCRVFLVRPPAVPQTPVAD
jgi:amino acid transporter/nucleotide-binding universal stress UspA family protein